MKGIRIFQRFMITLLIGLNTFVFSISSHVSMTKTCFNTILTISTTVLLIAAYEIALKRYSSKKKKQGISQS
jgi:hypothetical protein